ncbi:hypothetical protein [Endozoicomonas atrinae]|uniref:hypothetical protein n=1 Tax=Endozoicomonas atrinae TaxID=1333660 RepID=UPI003B0081D9
MEKISKEGPEGFKDLFNSPVFNHLFELNAFDPDKVGVITPAKPAIDCFFARLKLDNATSKYKEEKYEMYTGQLTSGEVFLVAPRNSRMICENTNDPTKILFNGNPSRININALYIGQSFEEIIELIRECNLNCVNACR